MIGATRKVFIGETRLLLVCDVDGVLAIVAHPTTQERGVKIVSGHVVGEGDIANGPLKLVDVGDAELVELVK